MKDAENLSHTYGLPGLVTRIAALVAALAVLEWVGQDPRLMAPDLTAPGAWGHWAARDPLDIVFMLLRAVLTMVDLYLVALLGLALIARITGAVRVMRLLDLCTVPVAHSIVRSAIGVTLATSTVTGPALPVAARQTVPSSSVVISTDPTSATVDAAPGPTDPPDANATAEDDVPLLWRLPRPTRAPVGPALPPPLARPWQSPPRGAEEFPSPSPGPTPRSTSTAAPAGTNHTDTPGTDTPRTRPDADDNGVVQRWEVHSGDHFWAIAESTLGRRIGRVPSEHEVRRYWRRLIEENRSRLVDSENPDLILPGQVFVLPPVPR